ncbi:hypothetical protein C0992_000951 [Termitomyces sp. T32_za158]|nr:hypothetical protein C0992_000951 [Termitomyces sp. T32_za158]
MARVRGEEPIKVLQDVSDEAVVVAKRAYQILKDAPAAQRAFKQYVQGSIRLHLDVAHYRLPEEWKKQYAGSQ